MNQRSVTRRAWLLGALVAAGAPACSNGEQTSPPLESAGSVRSSLNSSPTVEDFVIYADNSVRVHPKAVVLGGDVGVRRVGTGPSLVPGFEAAIEPNALLDIHHDLLADDVLLKPGSRVGDIECNRLSNQGVHGGVAPLPAMPPLPGVAEAMPGHADLVLGNGQVQQVGAGVAYDRVVLSHNAVIRLEGGAIDLRTLTMHEGSRLEALAPVLIRVGVIRIRARSIVAIPSKA